MPFTFSHPAVILPFMRVRYPGISMSAMVVGSIAPDFEYFLRMNLEGRFSHTAMGVFLLDVPMAALLYFLFHLVIKRYLVDFSPAYFRDRLQALRRFDAVGYWNDYYIHFLVCILIGVGTHILLDSLTHERDYIVQSIEFFRTTIRVEGLPEYPTYKYVYYVGSVIGAVMIAVVFHFNHAESSKGSKGSWLFWIGILVIAVVVFYVTTSGEFDYFGSFVVAVIGSLFWGILATSIFYRVFVNGQKENVGTSREKKG